MAFDLNGAVSKFTAQANQQQQQQQADTPGSASTPGLYDWFAGFTGSALESIPELIGIDAGRDTQRWRRDNPIGGVASQLAGAAVPYAGWVGATERIPAVAGFLRGIGTAERPILAGAMREVARMAPFEVGRQAIGQVFGDTPLVDAASEAVFNTALAGAFGGFVGAISGAGSKTTKLSDLVPGADMRAPPQVQLRGLQKALTDGTIPQEVMLDAQQRAQQLSKAIRLEEFPSARGQYVQPLEVGGNSRDLNRLFRTGGVESGGQLVRRRFVTSSRDFPDDSAWRQAAEDFGLPKNFPEYGQYYRELSFKSDRAANAIQQAIVGRGNLQPLGDGWFWGKEANDGLYVMAKKLGDPARPSASDRWVTFKTDTPGAFVPGRERWADSQVRANAWLAEPVIPATTGADLLDSTRMVARELPLVDYAGMVDRAGGIKRLADRVGKVTGMTDAVGEYAYLGERVKNFFKEYFAPTMFQFADNPRAHWIMGVARSTYDRATANAQAILNGEAVLPQGSLWRAIWSGAGGEGKYKGGDAILSLRRQLDDQDLALVHKAWTQQWSPEQIQQALAQNAFTPRAAGFLNRLNELDNELIGQIQTTQRALGLKEFTPLPNHYMISRTWKGDWRVPVVDEAGETVYMASGVTRKAAQKQAEQIVTSAAGDNRTWKAMEPKLSDRTQDLEVVGRLPIKNREWSLAQSYADASVRPATPPKFFDERKGVAGYVGEKAPWTGKELDDILTAHIVQQQKYLAGLVTNSQLESDLLKLSAEAPAVFQQVTQRLNDLAGKPGPLSQLQNTIVDKVMAPVLGKNSATKIVRTANDLVYHLNLGGLNLAFPVVNALTFLQTTLPHIAFVTGATPQRIARYYSHFPMAGADGLPKGSVGAVDMFRIMRQSMKELGKPDGVLRQNFEKAAREGVWDPRFVEEFVGQNSREATRLKDVVSGAEGFSSWLRAVSNFLPAQTEKFSRGHTFTVGHIVGRDFLGMKDPEKLYRFAKEFTNNTMYLYGTADRARIMTGPLGSLFGMFKNWQMHYIGSMLEYTGEAFMRGNWSPLLWMIGGTGSVGGVAALPMYGVVDQFSKWASGKSAMQQVYSMFGAGDPDDNIVADGIFLGLPAALPQLLGLPGVSMSGQVAAPSSDPTRDASQLFSFVHMDRMRALGKAIGSAVDHWSVTGEHPISDPTTRMQFVQALAPKTLYRVLAAWEDKMIRAAGTGYPVMKNVSPVERLMYVAGFSPKNLELAYRTSDELWKSQTSMRNAIAAYGEAWAAAQQARDGRQMWTVMQNAMASGVDLGSVLRSANARLAKGREAMIDRQFDPMNIMPYRRLGIIQ